MAFISGAALIAAAAGSALAIAAEKKGQRTPGGGILRAGGLDVSGGAFNKIPQLAQAQKSIKPLPTIDDAAVKAARNNTLLRLQQRSGLNSTLLSNTQGTKTTFGS